MTLSQQSLLASSTYEVGSVIVDIDAINDDMRVTND